LKFKIKRRKQSEKDKEISVWTRKEIVKEENQIEPGYDQMLCIF